MTSFMPSLSEPAESLEESMALEQLRAEFDGRMTRMENQLAEQSGQLTKLILAVEGYKGNQEQTLMMLQRIVNRHDEQLNGFHDKPGLIVKVDRLETTESTRRWHLRAIWTALVAVASNMVADLFRK